MKGKTLGTMIAESRKQQGMTQLELANKMGVTDKAVSKWERGLSCPDINSFAHLAEILNISVDELLQNDAANHPPKTDMKKICSLIFKAIALAMGIAVIVLSFLNKLEAGSGIAMLGIGLTSLALYALQDKD